MEAKPDFLRLDQQVRSTEEVASVFQTAEYRVFAKAIGLKNALRAGFSPNLDIVNELHEALWKALLTADEEEGLEPKSPIDARLTRATKATIRGVFKRYEEAFEVPGARKREP
jgi:hypothetical protein